VQLRKTVGGKKKLPTKIQKVGCNKSAKKKQENFSTNSFFGAEGTANFFHQLGAKVWGITPPPPTTIKTEECPLPSPLVSNHSLFKPGGGGASVRARKTGRGARFQEEEARVGQPCASAPISELAPLPAQSDLRATDRPCPEPGDQRPPPGPEWAGLGQPPAAPAIPLSPMDAGRGLQGPGLGGSAASGLSARSSSWGTGLGVVGGEHDSVGNRHLLRKTALSALPPPSNPQHLMSP
jgi:hypothetical protein